MAGVPKNIPRVKNYKDYLAEYNKKASAVMKQRLKEAKQRRGERIKKGINIESPWIQLNAWTSPINPLKD